MLRIVPSQDAGRLLKRRSARMTEAETTVRPILDAVRARGDAALLEYARRFDKLQRKTVAVPQAELDAAARRLSPAFRKAVAVSAKNVRAYARLQLPVAKRAQPSPGLKLSQVIRPLDSVAAYIPSGRYPLPSTVIMTVVPALAAGVPNVMLCTPRPVDEIFGTAALLKANRVFEMGGAHAIAAFAFGTRTVPRADRIVGPGNIYVAAAKKLLAGEVGIDFVAGPTEILIICDEGNPAWLAADMLAQAEHDTDASAILLTTSRSLAAAVAAEVERQLATLPTAPIARAAIDRNSAIILVDSPAQAVELSNRFAPEHLSIHDPSLLPAIRHAGSVFVGSHSTEAAGDYASGPNHVLPTSGAARLRGGLSAADYVKVISVQQLSPRALRSLAPAITPLARAEGLEAHARSVETRLTPASARERVRRSANA
ncbi:MAG: histidinol dehydrogenase [Acidobacteria bacterium]|nr:histidinol dehydrogenase [Acidobacteriota bacterium]